MPRILEIKEIDGEAWVRVGKPGEFENGVTIATPQEWEERYDEGFHDGIITASKHCAAAAEKREQEGMEKKGGEIAAVKMLVGAMTCNEMAMEIRALASPSCAEAGA